MAEATVHFDVRKFGRVRVNGTLPIVDAHAWTEGDSLALSGTAIVAGIATGIARRDEHLRGPDFLDESRHPLLALSATGLRLGAGAADVHGILTLKGLQHPIVLRAHAEPGHGGELRVRATGVLDRRAVGLVPPNRWDRIVGRDIALTIDLVVARADHGEAGR